MPLTSHPLYNIISAVCSHLLVSVTVPFGYGPDTEVRRPYPTESVDMSSGAHSMHTQPIGTQIIIDFYGQQQIIEIHNNCTVYFHHFHKVYSYIDWWVSE